MMLSLNIFKILDTREKSTIDQGLFISPAGCAFYYDFSKSGGDNL